jgi:putative membrane protein
MNDWTPYCGAPPVPQDLWLRWNFDPWLIGALLAVAAIWIVYTRGAQVGHIRTLLFWGGVAVTALAFISPLCALSMALFSARVGQHLILTLLAAPMIAFALPFRRAPRSASLLASALIFAVLFWFWHLPQPYAATLHSDAVYWTMHITLLASAVFCWFSLVRFQRPDLGAALVASALSATQMSLFSALLFFSRNAWHEWHEVAAWPWGLDALADQQLGALLMWVPGAMVFLLVLLAILRFVLTPDDEPGNRSAALVPNPQPATHHPTSS